MFPKFSFEVCIDSVESALAAESGGAHRVELCDNLVEGGTTPSLGMIKQVKKHCSLPVMVMIRPRGGDFFYNEYELAVMKEDILMAKEAGADGLVMGLLNVEGDILKDQAATLRELAGDLPCTFHRAFDMTRDSAAALEDVIDCGFNMILTSGQEESVVIGREHIEHLHDLAKGRIHLMAGAGIRAENVGELILHTGVHHIHASASHSISSPMKYRNPNLSMGVQVYDEYKKTVVSQEIVSHILQAANKAWMSEKF